MTHRHTTSPCHTVTRRRHVTPSHRHTTSPCHTVTRRHHVTPSHDVITSHLLHTTSPCHSRHYTAVWTLLPLPFNFTSPGPSDFGLLRRLCLWLLCSIVQFSGAGLSVHRECCTLLDVVAVVVFGCRYIVTVKQELCYALVFIGAVDTRCVVVFLDPVYYYYYYYYYYYFYYYLIDLYIA